MFKWLKQLFCKHKWETIDYWLLEDEIENITDYNFYCWKCEKVKK